MPLKTHLGDKLPSIVLQLLGQDDLPIDQTGLTAVALIVRRLGSDTPTATVTGVAEGPAADASWRFENPGFHVTEAGHYIASVVATFAAGVTMTFPEDPDDGMEIEVNDLTTAFSNLESFRVPLRVLLGDVDTVPMYSNQSLDDGVRTAVQMGLVEGYTLTATRNAITPAVTVSADFAAIALETARLFVSGRPDRQSVRTRVASESVGSYKELLRTIEDRLSEIRGGKVPLQTWQSLYSFMVGTQGLPDIALFSTVKVEQSLKEFSVYARSSNI